MKTSFFISLLTLSVSFLSAIPGAGAQQMAETQISYKVTFGPVFPIEGTSSQLVGKISLNDTTEVLEKLDFEVPLNSFVGQNAGYLAWIGNSWTFPDLRFRSNRISQQEKEYTVKGNLDFRGRYSPTTVKLVRRDKGNQVILSGEFTMLTHDFFIVAPSFDLVPAQIPFQLTMVFDKPVPKSSTSTSDAAKLSQ